ncbi:unnamed protein product [Phytomonas sp. EM1]|nr:unnamed protein product [Phytomonas sp. EM1]|eukprot:CCW65745.1 unnamed protein product [Phytomonas sp. isolate EM1]
MHSNEKGHEEGESVIVNLPQSGLDRSEGTAHLNATDIKRRKELANNVHLPVIKSVTLAGTYVLASMAYYFCISYSKLNYIYSVAPLVAMTEVVKMAICIALKYCIDGELIPQTILLSDTRGELWKRGLPYVIPAFLYAVYNNMTFINLDNFDLGTYQVFMQTRIWFTGIVFTVVLGQALSLRKWLALTLLAFGVTLKYFSPSTFEMGSWVGIVILQAFISSLAGVYNEYMFKKDPGFSIHMQNFFMYFYGIVFNILFGVVLVPNFGRELTVGISQTRIFVVIVLVGAVTGITASFILKFTNIIVKALASGVEVPLTAIMAAILLGERLCAQDVVAAVMVMLAIYMYYTKGFGDSRLINLNFRKRERLNVVSQEV